MRIFRKIGLLVSLVLTLMTMVSLNVFAQSETPIAAERIQKNITREISKEKDLTASEENFVPAPETITATTYAFTAGTDTLENMAGSTQLLGASQDDVASSVFSTGFEFWFDGVRYTQFSANSNGLVGFGGTAVTSSAANDLATASPKVSAYWDDLCTSATGQVHAKVIGAAPNRKLVIEFQNMIQYSGGCTAGVSAGTFQVWVYEARHTTSPGVIEFVYGGTPVNSNTFTGYSTGISSSATSFASVTTATDTVSYAASNNTQLTAIPAGKAYLFTPNIPVAPSNLTFGASTATTVTLNYTDNSSNEVGFAIYRSTDGVNYTFVTQVGAGITTYTDTGRTPNTTYFYQVYAVTEGALSSVLTGSQATAAAGEDTCNGAGGLYNATTTWADGTVPTATDNVTIQSGCTVTINVTTATGLNVTVQNGGTLVYLTGTASTLTANGDVTVDTGGTFTAGAGVLLTHVLNIGGSSTASGAAGNLTVNGTFDMNTTAGVVTTNFFGSANSTLSGTGATCDFYAIVMQKGTTNAAILDVTRVITINAPAATGTRLTATTGTFRLSSASTLTPYFGSQTIAAANGRIWINNAGASITVVGVGTTTGAGSPTISGQLRVDAGTFGYGSGNNAMTIPAGGSLVINGVNATVNMFGSVTFSGAASTFTMTAGNFNVDPQAANALAGTSNIVRFGTGAVIVNFTGGTLTIVDPHAATGAGTALSISASATTVAGYNFFGGTIRFGDGVSTTAGSVDGFDIDTFVGASLVNIGNVLVNNTATNAATRFVRAANAFAPFQQLYNGSLTTTNAGGSEFRLNGHQVAIVGNVINDGIINGSTAASDLYFFGNGAAQTLSGAGTFTGVLPILDVDNPLGLTITHANQIAVLRVNLFDGLVTGSNKLTIGNGGTTAAVVQIGVTGSTIPGGSFDQSPTYNLGAGSYTVTYQPESVARTTGFEIPPSRSITALTVNNTNGVTLAGGDLTVTGAMTLTGGIVTTNANTLTHNGTATRTNGFVVGNLSRSYAATGAYTYFVGDNTGTAEYSPMTATITALGVNPSSLTVSVTDATLTGLVAATAASRYWTLTEGGDLTADLSFNYLEADTADPAVDTDETNYRVFKREGTVVTPQCVAPCVNTTTNVAGPVTGVTSFSDWGIGTDLAPTAAEVQVGGRVTLANGRGVFRARVTMVEQDGDVRMAFTNQFGYYHFANVASGGNYIFSVAHRRYQFANQSQVIFVAEAQDDINFVVTGESGANPNARFFDNAPFDFDGDGRTDVAVFRPSENNWYVKHSSDNTWSAQAFGAAGDRLAPADFDGDGKTDLAVYRPSEGNWYVWLSASNSLRVERFGTAADVPVAADYDGDLKADFGMWNAATGVWQVRLSADGTTVTQQFTIGRGAATPIASDRDGDGKADFVLFSSSNGNWQTKLSSGGDVTVERFGQKGDRAAIGDFDGDGRGDLAVFRSSENSWYIRLADGKDLPAIAVNAADKLAIGDFDGDGKADVANFKNGVWSIRQSVNDATRQQQFGLASDVVIPSADR